MKSQQVNISVLALSPWALWDVGVLDLVGLGQWKNVNSSVILNQNTRTSIIEFYHKVSALSEMLQLCSDF